MDRHNIVLHRQTRMLTCNMEKEKQIEILPAFHLEELKRGLISRLYNEDLMENVGEIHFVVNFHNGLTLCFQGDNTHKYVDVVSGGPAMTMVVRIMGSCCRKIMAPMMIFTNPHRSYPICGVQDNLSGLLYQIASKEWMD